MNKKYNNTQIIELHSAGLTDKEIAEIVGVTPNNMANKRRSLGLPPNKSKRETHILSKEEIEVICGTLLGDATIRYVHSQCKYPNLTFTHCPEQVEYFNWLSNKLTNLKSSCGEYNQKYVKISGETAKRLVFTGMNMPCLVEIYNTFYQNGIKILPISFLDKHFSKVSLYCLFMDDGSYDIHTNSYILNTQCFDLENLREFIKLLDRKFGLKFNIKTDNCLYLKHESNTIFKSILLEINECNSMLYKCGSRHKTPLNGETPEMDNPVLNLQETEENAERLEVMPNE